MRQVYFLQSDKYISYNHSGRESIKRWQQIPPVQISLQMCGEIRYDLVQGNSNCMQRQLNQQSLGKAYREFSRQKYNKYRHQFSSMRESQVVVKIIKEWEKLSIVEKVRLHQKFTQLNCYHREKKELLSTANKSNYSPGKDQSPHKQVESALKVYPARINMRVVDDDSNFNRGSEKLQEHKSERQSSYSLLLSRREKDQLNALVKTPKRNQYIKFYQNEYQRQTKLHPMWNSIEISQIIKLMWAKQLKNDKITRRLIKKRIIIKSRRLKKVSGRQFYNTMKERQGYSTKQIILGWRRLTLENKVMFHLNGKGQMDYSSKREWRGKTVSLKMNESELQPASYMFKPLV